jgi:hypothetical protein
VSLPAFDPRHALRVLAAHEVRFVLIGGLAGRLWGSPTVTNDLDLCYARDRGNLERLSAALVELQARLRGVEDEVPYRLDAETLAAGDSFTFVTDAGNLDVRATPAGTQGFDDLARAATEMDLGDVTVRVVDVEDLVRMKRAAGRAKDLIEAEVLAALREELGR